MNTILTLDGVTKRYEGVVALQDLSLEVRQGEWVSIMGSSGSGKTTLLNILACLERPSGGRMYLDGVEIGTLPESDLDVIRREKVGMVFQQFHLVPYLTATENVMLAQHYHSMADRQEARRALQEVGVGSRADAYPHQLSGGEKQRICIARALINYPVIILADEPTGNLDEANQQVVLDLFRDLHRQGHTLIVVSHDPEVAEAAQRQLVLEHGRLRDAGAVRN